MRNAMTLLLVMGIVTTGCGGDDDGVDTDAGPRVDGGGGGVVDGGGGGVVDGGGGGVVDGGAVDAGAEAVASAACDSLPALISGGEGEYLGAVVEVTDTGCEARRGALGWPEGQVLFFDWSSTYWNIKGTAFTLDSTTNGMLSQGTGLTRLDSVSFSAAESTVTTTVRATQKSTDRVFDITFAFVGGAVRVDSLVEVTP